MDFQTFLLGVAYIFPAYVSNATPVVAVKLFRKAHPIDGGAVFVDGRRLLGNGKTVEGFFSGTAAGVVTGLLINNLLPSLHTFVEIFFLSVGAMLGDVIGAFVKRRIGIAAGKPAPVLDQLGFLIVSLAFVYFSVGLPGWLDTLTIIVLMLFTAFMHVGTNTAAYFLRLKDKWW